VTRSCLVLQPQVLEETVVEEGFCVVANVVVAARVAAVGDEGRGLQDTQGLGTRSGTGLRACCGLAGDRQETAMLLRNVMGALVTNATVTRSVDKAAAGGHFLCG
jgi:hypothetical protein